MKILLVALGYRGYGTHYADALRAAGHDVDLHIGLRQGDLLTRLYRLTTVTVPSLVGANRDYEWSEQRRLTQGLGRRTAPYDLALFVNSHQLASDHTLRSLASRGIRTGLWLLDDIDTLPTNGLSLDSFDYLASFSRVDAARLADCAFVPQGLALAGPVAARRAASRPLVLGAPYPRRREVAVALADAGIAVDVVGQTWKSFALPDGLIRVHGDVSLARSMEMSADARVCVNAHRRVDTGLSPRVFEIAGAGGLPITDNVFAPEFLEPGREMLHWSDPLEAVEHVQRAIREPRWAYRIAARARQRVRAEHTIERRFRSLLSAWRLAA